MTKLLKTAAAFVAIALIGAGLGEVTDSMIAEFVFIISACATMEIW